eukprot:3471057-Pyramimonas_sp.AAC.2
MNFNPGTFSNEPNNASTTPSAEPTQEERELIRVACEVGKIANQLPTVTVRTKDPDAWMDFQDDLASVTSVADLATR